jgi:hypothetical protein
VPDIEPSSQPVRPARTRSRAALVVLGLVLCGVVIGVVGDRLLLLRLHRLMPRGGPGPSTNRIVERLAHDLDLTPVQTAAVAQIVRRHHDRVVGIWGDVGQQMHKDMDEARREIDQVLTPAQREKFRRLPHPRRGRFLGFGAGPPGSH